LRDGIFIVTICLVGAGLTGLMMAAVVSGLTTGPLSLAPYVGTSLTTGVAIACISIWRVERAQHHDDE
jgi:hypothetical protein